MTTKKYINKIKSFTLVLVMLAAFVPSFTASASEKAADLTDSSSSITLKDNDGDGAYEISTLSELNAFANLVNGGQTTINAKLTANIACDNAAVTNIGSSASKKYNGTFDGNGKIVSGISIQYGLFRYVGGTVKDLTVKDAVVTEGLNEPVGGIVNTLSGGTVDNCKFIGGTVTKSNTIGNSDTSVGGIVGYIDGSGNIKDCENSGSITSKTGYVGGIVGTVYGSAAQCQITGCKNSGNVTNNTTEDYQMGAGGIIGYVYGTYGALVSKCYNTGNINGVRYSGGILGVGRNVTVSLCGNVGQITGTENNVGGIAGGLMENSEMESCYNIGNVSGKTYAGGVVGNLWIQSSTQQPASVSGCYSSCIVTATDGVAGGLAGVVCAYNILKDSIYDNTKYTGGASGTVKGTVLETQGLSTGKFENGEVCYILNSKLSESGEDKVWGQYIGADGCPVLGGKEVLVDDNGNYYNDINEFLILSNSENNGKAVAKVAVPTAGTYMLIFAHYESGALKTVDAVEVTSLNGKEIITKSSDNQITLGKDDKIMLWSSNCAPKCNAYVVE